MAIKRAILAFVLLGQAVICSSPANAVQVCQVHDGDTFTTCQGQRVRLFGIDAPELKQQYGYPARNTLKSMVLGQEVSLKCDGKSYNRKVCQVFLGNLNVNEAMVQQGFAYDYAHYSHGAYLPAQQYAQDHHLGVWDQNSGGVRPWDYRKHTSKKRTNQTFHL